MLTFLCNLLDGTYEILHELVLTFCVVGWMYHEIFYELMLTFCIVGWVDQMTYFMKDKVNFLRSWFDGSDDTFLLTFFSHFLLVM